MRGAAILPAVLFGVAGLGVGSRPKSRNPEVCERVGRGAEAESSDRREGGA